MKIENIDRAESLIKELKKWQYWLANIKKIKPTIKIQIASEELVLHNDYGILSDVHFEIESYIVNRIKLLSDDLEQL